MAASATTLTRDPDIRRMLVERLDRDYGADPNTFVRHEFSICRSRARIDIAVINGTLAGFEIKSAADRLDRLSRQAAEFDKVFDSVTVVCAPRHLERIASLTPDRYGIWVAEPLAAQPIQKIRAAGTNPTPRARALAALLWRDEMLAVLEEHGLDVPTRAPRRALVEELLGALPAERIHVAVLQHLKSRFRSLALR